MQATGDLVAVPAELAAGVELRQHDRQRRQILLGHEVDRDAVTPVPNRDGMVRMEDHLDALVASREGLVDGVVDDLVEEVMEAPLTRRADVHARAQPDRLEALENGDVFCCIGGFSHEKSPANTAFAGYIKCIRTSGRPGALRRLARGSHGLLGRPARAALRPRSQTPTRPLRALAPG